MQILQTWLPTKVETVMITINRSVAGEEFQFLGSRCQ
jgi:hypothetical protein